MDRTKVVIGIFIGLIVLCACCCLVGTVVSPMMMGTLLERSASTTEDPAQVSQIAENIVTYQLPSGYEEQFGLSFFGFDMVAFGKEDFSGQIFVLMQVPDMFGLSPEEMAQQIEQSLQQQTGRQTVNMQVVDTIQTTIRDQNVTLTVQEGTDAEGTSIRQITGAFAGRNGAAMLMIIGPTQSWNQEAVNSFLASLR